MTSPLAARIARVAQLLPDDLTDDKVISRLRFLDPEAHAAVMVIARAALRRALPRPYRRRKSA